jgi:hypothetical protein
MHFCKAVDEEASASRRVAQKNCGPNVAYMITFCFEVDRPLCCGRVEP